jgi:hypothetical protein
MNSGIFKPAVLFIAGTTRAWYLYLAYALLAAVLLVFIWIGRRTGDFSDAVDISAICSVVMWLIVTVGILPTMRQLRELCVPQPYRRAGLVLGLAALFTLVLPTALLVWFGDAAPEPGAIRHVFMTLALGAATGMLMATLPLPLVSAGLMFGPLLFVGFPHVKAQLTHSAFWQSAWHMEAATLLALPIVAWRCRSLIRSETTGGLLWASLAQWRVNMSTLFVAAGHDPNAAYEMFPAWMLPSGRTRAGASLWSRLSILMGPPFTPGNLRQVLLQMVVIGGLMVPFLRFFMERGLAQRLPAPAQRMFLDTLLSLIPAACIMFLVPMAKVFATRLRMIHRPQSADLAELALLPGLGGGRTPLANYSLVIFGRPLRTLVAIAAVLVGAVLMLANVAPWNLLWLVPVIAGLAVMESARYLAAGRPYMQNVIFDAFATMAVMISVAALEFVSARTSNAISHAAMPAIAIIVWLAAIQSVRRAYATARHLPHPFLDADERRVMTLA